LATVWSAGARIYRWRDAGEGARAPWRAQEQKREEKRREEEEARPKGRWWWEVVVEASSEACYVAALGHPAPKAARFF